MLRRCALSIAIGCVLIFLAGNTAAHELIVPEVVFADAEGHFAYEVIVVVSVPIEFGYTEVDGTDNTDIGHWHADGFCMHVREPGEYIWPMEGSLVDTGVNGSVIYAEYLCDGWYGEGTTLIIAPTVSVEAVSWTSLKAVYR